MTRAEYDKQMKSLQRQMERLSDAFYGPIIEAYKRERPWSISAFARQHQASYPVLLKKLKPLRDEEYEIRQRRWELAGALLQRIPH